MLPSMVPPIVGPFSDAFPDRQLSILPGEFGAQPREGDAVLNAGRSARRQAIKRALALDGEVPDVDQALFGAGLDRRRVHRQFKLAAHHFGIGVGEAQESAGVIGFEIDHVASLGAAAQIRGQRRIASKLAAERQASDHAVAPG